MYDNGVQLKESAFDPEHYDFNEVAEQNKNYQEAKRQVEVAQPAEHLLKFYQSYGFKIIRPIYYEGKTYCSWILEKPI